MRYVHVITFISGVRILVVKSEAQDHCLGFILGLFPPKYAKNEYTINYNCAIVG